MHANIFRFVDPEGTTQYGVDAEVLQYSFMFSPSLKYLADSFGSEWMQYIESRSDMTICEFAPPNHPITIRGAKVSSSRLSVDEQECFKRIFDATVQQRWGEWQYGMA